MSVVYILVFAAILMAGGFLVAFIWSVKSGQYEDTYTPSVRILFDDAVKKEEDGNEHTGRKSQLSVNQKAEVGSQETEDGRRKTGHGKTETEDEIQRSKLH